MLTVIKKLMNYCNYMTPEEIALYMMGVDCTAIDLKPFNNHFANFKKRKVEREDKRMESRKLPIECTKKVAMRLQKKLLFSGKTPNLGPNFFA